MSAQKPLDQLKSIHNTITSAKGSYLQTQAQLDAMQSKLEPDAAALLEAFAQWDIPLKKLDEDNGMRSSQPYQLIVLMLAELATQNPDTSLPDWFLPYVFRLCTLRDRLDLTTRIETLFKQLPPSSNWVDYIQLNPVRAGWQTNQCMTLLDLIDDEEELSRILDKVMLDAHTTFSYTNEDGFLTHHSGCDVDSLVRRLVISGPNIRARLEAHMAPDLPLTAAQVIMHLSRLVNSPASATMYVTALGHKSKEIQELASSALTYLGARARPALEEGTSAKKKNVRQFCEHLLSLLPEQPVVDPFLDLDESDRYDLIELLLQNVLLTREESAQWGKGKTPEKWQTLITRAAANPTLHLSALSSIYFATRDSIGLLEATLRDEAFADQQLYGWTAFMRALVQAYIKDSYTKRFAVKEFYKVPGAHVKPILKEVLATGFGPIMVDLLPIYLEDCTIDDPEIYLRALTSSSKAVRELAIKKANRIAFEDISLIVKELDGGTKNSRLAAAEVLSKAPVAIVTPHLDAIAKHLDKEKDAGVQGILEATIARVKSA